MYCPWIIEEANPFILFVRLICCNILLLFRFESPLAANDPMIYLDVYCRAEWILCYWLFLFFFFYLNPEEYIYTMEFFKDHFLLKYIYCHFFSRFCQKYDFNEGVKIMMLRLLHCVSVDCRVLQMVKSVVFLLVIYNQWWGDNYLIKKIN